MILVYLIKLAIGHVIISPTETWLVVLKYDVIGLKVLGATYKNNFKSYED